MSTSFRFVKDSGFCFWLLEPFRPCTVREDVLFWRTLSLLPFVCMLGQSERSARPTPFVCPPVAPTDDGIRPAGPDECFYCRQKVGSPHLFACVTVTVPRTYRVLLDGVDIGSWSTDDPVGSNRDMRHFHKNESSWCANNVMNTGTLSLSRPLPVPEPEHCLCDYLAIEPVGGEPEYEDATGPAAGDPITATRERYRETEMEDL